MKNKTSGYTSCPNPRRHVPLLREGHTYLRIYLKSNIQNSKLVRKRMQTACNYQEARAADFPYFGKYHSRDAMMNALHRSLGLESPAYRLPRSSDAEGKTCSPVSTLSHRLRNSRRHASMFRGRRIPTKVDFLNRNSRDGAFKRA